MDDPGRPSDRMLSELIDSLTTPNVEGTGEARVDVNRAMRRGVPEVIFAENRSAEQIIAISRTMLTHSGRVIISRVTEPLLDELRAELSEAVVMHQPGTWTAVVHRPDVDRPSTGGRVAIVTAGTSDLPAATEARIVAEEMGCTVEILADMGVAGLHRLFGPLRRVIDEGVDALVVVAGMDGALPSVVAGLVPVPVIGLPTSVGYGLGGRGEAALLSMLQTCVPGLTVVNIDNAVGAGASAAMIANAVARARRQP